MMDQKKRICFAFLNGFNLRSTANWEDSAGVISHCFIKLLSLI